MSTIVVQTPPAAEPIDLATVKQHLRVTLSDDDALITTFIQAARELVEGDTGRSLVNKLYRQSHDHFPHQHEAAASGYFYSAPRYAHHHDAFALKLLRCPLVSVTKITYTGTDGLSHDLLPNTDFQADSDSEPPRLLPLYGQVWPVALRVPNAVQVFFTGGYGADGTNVPANLKIAMMNLCATWYEYRESISPTDLRQVPDQLQRFLWSERVTDFNPTL